LKELLSVLGFEFLTEIQDDSEIIKLIDKRNQLRANKEYDKADQIRNDLLSMGIEILDSKEGTNFRRI
jgi:cysteinyl-tRNA synthetase